MECKEAEELIGPYLLRALDPEEVSQLESHIAGCPECGRRVREEGEVVAQLAYAVPILQAPQRIKGRLFSRIDRESKRAEEAERRRARIPIWDVLARHRVPSAAAATATLLVVGLVLGGIWFNDRLDRVAEENLVLQARMDRVSGEEGQSIEAIAGRVDQLLQDNRVLLASVQSTADENTVLQARMDRVSGEEGQSIEAIADRVDKLFRDNRLLLASVQSTAEEEVEIMEMVKEQRLLTYMTAAPGTSVNMLWSTDRSMGARGMIVVGNSRTMEGAILAVLDLPAPPPGTVYKVWLIKDGRGYEAGHVTVDSTGYGQTIVIPIAPWGEFDAIEITVEPVGDTPRPHGDRVLRGDL